MNTNHKIIGTAIAVLAATTAMTAAPTAAGANSPQHWDICPAADTVPLCEIVRRPHQSGTDGSEAAHLPAANGTAERTDIPDYIRRCRSVLPMEPSPPGMAPSGPRARP
jgi:hypothetical protein